MNTFKFSPLIILIFAILTSCLSDPEPTDQFDPAFLLEEGEETIHFQGDEGDFGKTLKFELYKFQYSLELPFENRISNHYKNAERNLHYYADQKPENTTQAFYEIFLNDDSDLYLLEGLLESLRSRSTGTEYDMVQLITSFVQSIPYEVAEIQKYPYETLFLNKGDCSDKSVLLCKLLILEGYDACLFVYEDAEHMSVGLKVDGNSYNSGYIYIESTAVSPIGEIPTELVGGIKIEEEPEVIFPSHNGSNVYNEITELKLFYKQLTQIYGKGYLHTSIKGKNLLEQMRNLELKSDSIKKEQHSLNKELDSLKIAINKNGCEGIVEEATYKDCINLHNTYDKIVENFNNLNIESTNNNEIYNHKVNLFNSLTK